MAKTLGRWARHLKLTVKTALFGPQILAFVPALTLGGYWYGGEGVLLFMAVLLPAVLGLVGLFTPMAVADAGARNGDAITGLPLRDRLRAALDKAFAEAPQTGLRTAALTMEIDDFASCRQQHGDGAADDILRQVAARLQTVLRDGDVASRIDGAVFAIALAPARRLDLEIMVQLSARLQQAVSEPIVIDGLRLFLTASIGFCLPRRASEMTAAACLDAAESALVEAQSSGTAAIRAYSAQPPRTRIVRSGLVGEVAEALECGQIGAWFQPQLCTDTGDVSGMEALARWEHPERGMILPGVFLPAIAAAGLTGRLGEVMLYQSLSALQTWDKAGLRMPHVGVNFSRDELSDPTLVDRIRWELDRFDLAPERLTIEVLEAVLCRADNDVVTRNLGQLAKMGCGIDLDDFGMGHASLASIRRFSVGRIKIDRSFVANVDTDREQQDVLAAILEMADRLGINTLAEGVESVGEHALLAQLGCGHVQGYSIARPMPFAETLDWIGAHRARLREQPKITRQAG
ncbi:MAG: bifunctional diguanylate cyclase/phosphodiesterase [Rhodobacter sp.]|nr:bifunctional diguanylate cyclase/phosphodiesterase [Rhodobacter sp.]